MATINSMKKLSKNMPSATELLRKRYAGNQLELEHFIKEERERIEIADLIYNARCDAGLTQAELAKLVGSLGNRAIIQLNTNHDTSNEISIDTPRRTASSTGAL